MAEKMRELDQKDINYFNEHLLVPILARYERDLQKARLSLIFFFKPTYELSLRSLQREFELIRKDIDNDDAIINELSDVQQLFSDDKFKGHIAYLDFILLDNPQSLLINKGLTFKNFLEAVGQIANNYLYAFFKEDTTVELLKQTHEGSKNNAMAEVGYKLRLLHEERLEQEHNEYLARHHMDYEGGFFKNNLKRQQKRKNSRKSKGSRRNQSRKSRRTN